MFELPECLVLSSQISSLVKGKTIARAATKNVEHKFVWHNRPPAEFSRLAKGKKVGEPVVRGRWMSVPLEPGYVLLFGECGGSLRFEEAGAKRPDKFHLLLDFEDSSFLWARTAMWGAYELYEKGKELERQYVKDQRPSPVDPRFTLDYFKKLVAALAGEGKRSAKSLLTQEQTIPGLGNAVAQDILFESGIAPKRDLGDLDAREIRALHKAITGKVEEIAAAGGRYDETDLLGKSGGYVRLMDKAATRRPCPRCGGEVREAQYLGGAVYWCPACQA
jgi:formamidopyrimidine-DNA glycosylase